MEGEVHVYEKDAWRAAAVTLKGDKLSWKDSKDEDVVVNLAFSEHLFFSAANPPCRLNNGPMCFTCKQAAVPALHCYNCSRSFCKNCAKHGMPLPRFGFFQRVRVCDSCVKKATSAHISKYGLLLRPFDMPIELMPPSPLLVLSSHDGSSSEGISMWGAADTSASEMEEEIKSPTSDQFETPKRASLRKRRARVARRRSTGAKLITRYVYPEAETPSRGGLVFALRSHEGQVFWFHLRSKEEGRKWIDCLRETMDGSDTLLAPPRTRAVSAVEEKTPEFAGFGLGRSLSHTSLHHAMQACVMKKSPSLRELRRRRSRLRPFGTLLQPKAALHKPKMPSVSFAPGDEVVYTSVDGKCRVGMVKKKLFEDGNARNLFEVEVKADGETRVFSAQELLVFKDARVRWRKGRLIGRGAYGKVYSGRNRATNEKIAVKEMPLKAVERSMGTAEAERRVGNVAPEISIMQTVVHPNVVRFIGCEVDRKRGKLYILMEWVSGGSLKDLYDAKGPLEEEVIQRYTAQIVRGLGYLHSLRIVHRDLKGGNILLSSTNTAKLADFGISKKLHDVMGAGTKNMNKTNLKTMIGSPFWMAPEVVREEGYGRKADIWSLGCTLVELATGTNPWGNMNTLAAVFAIAQTQDIPFIPPTLSPECQAFIRRCLQRNPENRPTAKELAQDPWLVGVSCSSEDSVSSEELGSQSGRADSDLDTSRTDLSCFSTPTSVAPSPLNTPGTSPMSTPQSTMRLRERMSRSPVLEAVDEGDFTEEHEKSA